MPEVRLQGSAHLAVLPEAGDARRARGYTAWGWTRYLADRLAALVLESPPSDDPAVRQRELLERREQIWEALLPSTWELVLRDVRPDRLVALRALLQAEAVQPHQMRLVAASERVHPGGDFGLLGSWGWMGSELGPAVPRGGLELLCARLLESGPPSAPGAREVLEEPEGSPEYGARPAVYRYQVNRTVRRRPRSYFLDSRPGDEPPVVHLTLDLELQRALRGLLHETLERHGAALAQGVAIDLESGAVLALDAVHRYPFRSFAPIHHVFTPGSTFKVITMAVALEAGLVQPGDELDVGQGSYRVPDSRRTIGEAEGFARGVVTAAECLAHSSNSGMVQIGLRVPQEFFEPRLRLLGYGRAPDTGLGGEIAGWFGEAGKPRWSRAYTHASISFGHEIGTTLWQHAAALAAVARGGEMKPLTLVEGVERDGLLWRPEGPRGERVFRASTSAAVRAMMELGALEGTGDELYRADLSMGTKTGTMEKVGGEVCLHAAGLAAAEGRAPSAGDRQRIPAELQHRSCYTSSVCIFGRAPAPGAPERMVMVVVEEPTRNGKFGSKVAGPAALALLERACGIRRPASEDPAEDPFEGWLGDPPGAGAGDGLEGPRELVHGFALSESRLTNPEETPWDGPDPGTLHPGGEESY